MIAHVYNVEIANAISAAHLPTVIFDPNNAWNNAWHARSQACHVHCDSAATGQMAAGYFIRKGFTSFAFIGDLHEHNWSCWRKNAFSERLNRDNFTCWIYPSPEPDQAEWEIEKKLMIKWLKKLPKPIAIFAANDTRARQVLNACQAAKSISPMKRPY